MVVIRKGEFVKKLIILVAVLILPVGSFALEKITDFNQKEKFLNNIKNSGNSCHSCDNVYVIGNDYRGDVYRVICNNNTHAYTVIINKTGKFTVKPW